MKPTNKLYFNLVMKKNNVELFILNTCHSKYHCFINPGNFDSIGRVRCRYAECNFRADETNQVEFVMIMLLGKKCKLNYLMHA